MTRPLRVLAALVLALVPLAGALARPQPAAGLTCDYPYSCITLTIQPQGEGSGTVMSVDSAGTPDGRIHCVITGGAVASGSVCSYRYRTVVTAQIVVSLSIAPSTGSCFYSFSGPDCGPKILSSQLVSDPTVARIEFDLVPETVSVTLSGEGTGRVDSTPAGISCPGTCSSQFLYGKALALKAMPDAGAAFKGWTGACAGQGATCTIHPKATTSTNAVFGLAPPPTPTPRATPRATPRPSGLGSTARASAVPSAASQAPATIAPQSTAEVSAIPASTAASTDALPTAVSPAAISLTTAPPVVVSATTTQPDLTPIAVAILGAGVLVAFAVLAGLAIGRRRP
jgi:hypothetical protein